MKSRKVNKQMFQQLQSLKIIALIATATLVGCATDQPVIKTVTQKVEIPVAIPCKTPTPPAPDFCFNKLTSQDDIFTDTKCLLSDRYKSQSYETDLKAALESCK